MLINLTEKNSHANSFFVRNMTCIPMSYFNSEGRIRELKGGFVDESQICGLFLLSCKPRDSRDVSNGADSFLFFFRPWCQVSSTGGLVLAAEALTICTVVTKRLF